MLANKRAIQAKKDAESAKRRAAFKLSERKHAQIKRVMKISDLCQVVEMENIKRVLSNLQISCISSTEEIHF